jgi:hypothetical protein
LDVRCNVRTAVDAQNKLTAEFEVANGAADGSQLTPTAESAKEILETRSITAVADADYDGVRDIVKRMDSGIAPHVAGTALGVCVTTDENLGLPIHSIAPPIK